MCLTPFNDIMQRSNASRIEDACRALVLQRICSRLLAIQPDHRPHSLAGFARMIRPLCQVKCYTISPVDVAGFLELPKKVQQSLSRLEPACEDWMLEEASDDMLHTVRQKWNRALEVGTFSVDETCKVAQWIAEVSFAQHKYTPMGISEELIELGFLKRGAEDLIDCSNLSQQFCKDLLLHQTNIPQRAWCFVSERSSTRHVALPAGCARALLVEHGQSIKSLQEQLVHHMERFVWRPSVKLSVRNGCTLEIKIKYVLNPGSPAHNFSDDLASYVRKHLFQFQRDRLAHNSRIRLQQQQIRSEAGQQYQIQLQSVRLQKQHMSSAERALNLPGPGVDGFGEEYIRKTGASVNCMCNRGIRRRRHLLRSKCRTLLRACAEVAPFVVQRHDGETLLDAATNIEDSASEQGRCQRLLGSSHLLGFSKAGSISLNIPSQVHISSAARRLSRQVAVVAQAAGVSQPSLLVQEDRSRGTKIVKQKKFSRGTKLGRRYLAAEISDNMGI